MNDKTVMNKSLEAFMLDWGENWNAKKLAFVDDPHKLNCNHFRLTRFRFFMGTVAVASPRHAICSLQN